MTDSTDTSELYQAQYDEAMQHFDNEDFDKCIEVAKRNLKDPNMPRYYQSRTCILIVSAMDDWQDADVWRLAAEQAYVTARQEASARQDNKELEFLQELREEFDTLEKQKNEEFATFMGAGLFEGLLDTGDDNDDLEMDMEMEMEMEMDDMKMELEMEMEDSLGTEDAVAIANAEDEDKVVGKTLDLPTRSAGEHESSGAVSPADATKSLRR